MRRSQASVVVLCAAAALASACGGPSFVPPPPETPPDDAIAVFLTEGRLPAVAVAVIDGDEVLYTRVAGVRKSGDPTPVADDDAFHIGSNTKAMTAVIAATVVDAGLLSWDATVGDVLTGTIVVGAPYRVVTLAQLLSHSSGLPEIDPAAELAFNRSLEPADVQRRQIGEKVLAQPPRSVPGAAFFYSNMNFVVAGLMLERATGTTWETLMAERIFGPLAMTHAGFGAPATPGTVDAPWGHDPIPVPPGSAYTIAPGFGPAGTVHASLSDMVGYVRVYLDGGLGPSGRIISEAALNEIRTPRLDHYGYGWFTGHDGAGVAKMWHNGSDGTFYSIIELLPDRRGAIIIMTNNGHLDAWTRVRDLRDYLAAHFGLPPRGGWTDE